MFTILARLAAPLLVTGLLIVVPSVRADAALSAAPAVTPVAATKADDRAHDAGTITGEIASVNYQRETIVVNAAGRGKTEIYVPPSASIQGKDDAFFTMADLKPGQRVEVYASDNGGRLVAQIIKLL